MEGITGVLFRGRINGSGTVVRARRNNGCRHAVRCNLLNLAVDLAILRRPAIRHGRRRSLPSATPRGARIPQGILLPVRQAGKLHVTSPAQPKPPAPRPNRGRESARTRGAPSCAMHGLLLIVYQPGPARELAPAGRRETFSLTTPAHRVQIHTEHTREVAL
jgi:hypothetical protein